MIDRELVVQRSFSNLTALCRDVGGSRSCVVAPGVYSEPAAGGSYVLVAAQETGYEGVACVDDAARLLVLLISYVRRRGDSFNRENQLGRLMDGLCNFIAMMQLRDGRFVNFILDWEGTKNLSGPTSLPGGPWWTGRALRALAWSSKYLGATGARSAFCRALDTSDFTGQWDQESNIVWATLDIDEIPHRSGGFSAMAWVDAYVESSQELPLADGPALTIPHLWGRTQEMVVSCVGATTGNSYWVALARESCHSWLRPMAQSRFVSRPTTLPCEVASAERNLRVVANLTGDEELTKASEMCREWFWGRNTAGIPVIDVKTGRVSDGLDGIRLSENSGAEANIEALSAIISL